jgi:hypothetical protein
MRKSTTYSSWVNMRNRCAANGSYAKHGITVCERWEKFGNFFADMGIRPDRMTLDRVDNSKGYAPDNCRWATRLIQANNRTNSLRVTAFGETLTAAEWERRLGLPRSIVSGRLRMGWSAEEAITTPPNP